jgi:hypothetical protein
MRTANNRARIAYGQCPNSIAIEHQTELHVNLPLRELCTAAKPLG